MYATHLSIVIKYFAGNEIGFNYQNGIYLKQFSNTDDNVFNFK